jgi:hypothetical protein
MSGNYLRKSPIRSKKDGRQWMVAFVLRRASDTDQVLAGLIR